MVLAGCRMVLSGSFQKNLVLCVQTREGWSPAALTVSLWQVSTVLIETEAANLNGSYRGGIEENDAKMTGGRNVEDIDAIMISLWHGTLMVS